MRHMLAAGMEQVCLWHAECVCGSQAHCNGQQSKDYYIALLIVCC